MSLTLLNLSEARSEARQRIVAQVDSSTLAAPSAQLIEALIGIPTSSGVAVTKERALRCVSYLSAVKMLASDVAKMPVCLEQITQVDGRQVTVEAIENPLYPILRYTPNPWMTAYQLGWVNTFNLLTQGNFYNQIVRDGLGRIVSLMPLNPWCVKQDWDLSDPNDPQRIFRHDENGNKRTFKNNEIWTCSFLALNGIEGQAIIALGKDALSLMIASDETAGRFFANGLNVHGFFTTPADMVVDEIQAQKVHDDLTRNHTGSNKAGKFPFLPGGWKYEKMALTAVEGQLLESRKWNAEEIARLLGGQPLITKLGYGEKNSTYASSAAFLEEYFSTSLMPITVNIEQSIALSLIAPKDRGVLCAEFDADVITRGSPKERAEIDEINIRSGKKSQNECREADGLDPKPGLDVHFFPANSGVINPDNGEMFLPAQKTEKQPAPQPSLESPTPTPAPSARLQALATAAAERVVRKETKGGKIDAEFIADVMSISVAKAEAYLAKRKSGEITDNIQAALVALAVNEERD
jgi:HK97 family phage portal protein